MAGRQEGRRRRGGGRHGSVVNGSIHFLHKAQSIIGLWHTVLRYKYNKYLSKGLQPSFYDDGLLLSHSSCSIHLICRQREWACICTQQTFSGCNTLFACASTIKLCHNTLRFGVSPPLRAAIERRSFGAHLMFSKAEKPHAHQPMCNQIFKIFESLNSGCIYEHIWTIWMGDFGWCAYSPTHTHTYIVAVCAMNALFFAG